ncbi:23S rRNA pseudouridine(955/2504/2580) synthase RluC [Enterobacterales bacterium endosymbiont of Anomoneura mori]|uniref:RluA family pseudouridine synthase n=1 Tax=Enterobacterales bacterium endosymbiont of Anomoneura mori TaxID=3132096 RepID=UPI00399C4F41
MKNIKKINFIKIDSNKEGQRIDNYLKNILKNLSKNNIYKIIRKGSVRINNKRINFFYKLKLGDLIRIKKQQKKKNFFYLENLEKKIIYEDNHILIIKKPSGISVHGGSGIKCGIIESLRILRNKEDFLELVHRLDRETSGILLIAKNRSSLLFLNNELRLKNIKKEYLALVHGKWNKKIKIIQTYIKNKKITLNNNKYKFSKTIFKIKEIFKFCTLIKILPITGRTHQIRIHTSYANHPILFDKLYGKSYLDNKFNNFKLNRLFLHANKIIFKHPFTKKIFKITSSIDNDLNYFLNILRKNNK